MTYYRPAMEKRNARKTLFACCGTHVLHDGLADITYVLLPVLAQTFGLSLAQVGLIRGAHRAALTLFQIPAGLLAERFGERNLLAIGTLISGLAFIWLGVAGGFLTVLASLFFAGLGGAFQHPLCSSIVSSAYAGGGRRAALGTYNFSGDLGKFIFAGATSLVIFAGFAWQRPVIGFGALAVVSAVAIVVTFTVIGAGGRPEPRPHDDDAPKVTGWGIRNPVGFSALCGIMIVDNTTRNGLLTFIAFLLIAKGLPEKLAVTAIPMILIGGMVGKLACGFLAERIGVIRTVVLTEVATGIGIFLILLLPNLAAYAILPIIGVALNGTSSVLYGTIGDLVESERQSRVFGLFYTLGTFCGILAPLAYGALGDAAGIEVAIAVAGVAVFLAIPLCLVLRPAVHAAAAAGD